MGKWRWVPGGDRAGRWKLCSKSYPPTSGLPICSVASSAWGRGQRQTLPASPGFPTALLWARQRRLSPQAGECLQQLHVRLRAWAGLLGSACWGVHARGWKGETRVAPGCPHLIPQGFVPPPRASILWGGGRGRGGSLGRGGGPGEGSRVTQRRLHCAGAAIAASVR